MARWRIGAIGLDREIARAIARRATPTLARSSRILTWCADEHLALPIAAGIWLLSRAGSVGTSRGRPSYNQRCGGGGAAASLETSDCAAAPGPPGDPWSKAWQSLLRQTLRRLSFGARDACRPSRRRSPARLPVQRLWFGQSACWWPPHGLSCSHTGQLTSWPGSRWPSASSGCSAYCHSSRQIRDARE